jgi:choline-sulfatase
VAIPKADSPHPNLLLVLSDQHNPHVLGCAGDRVVATPHLDRLAAEGVRCSAAYCGAPLCVPSRSTLLTGQSCTELQVWTLSEILPSNILTFAHALSAAGYDTVLCGRMHFAGADQRHGFGERIFGDVTSALLAGLPPNLNGQSYESTATAGPGRTGYQAYDAAVTATAVQWLRERAVTPTDRPFCLVVGTVLPHNPYIAPRPLFDANIDRVEVPYIPPDYLEALHPAVRDWRQARRVDDLTPEQTRTARAAYYGLVTMEDAHVGEIMAVLEETGLRQQTAVCYTSDHGDMAGELGMWWKSTLYEGSVGVPLLFSWPGHFPTGLVVPEPVSLIDLAPTLIDLGGGIPLPATSGRVLTPLLRGEALPVDWRPEVYAEIVPALGPGPARMVRRGPWKLVLHHGYSAPQLFNLDSDPRELHDLAGDPAHDDQREALLALAIAGWDGDEIVATLARRQDQRPPPDPAARIAVPRSAEYWPPPPGCNIFPE